MPPQQRQADRRYLNRHSPTVKTRKDADHIIEGYAAVFYREDDPGTEFWIWDDVVERIMPGAFDAALEEDVVRGMSEHRFLIGRTDVGTCRLRVDEVGLYYEIDAPDTQAGRDTVTLIGRRDLDGSSFAFSTWNRRGEVLRMEEIRDGKQVTILEVRNLELHDVGPVTYPAYAGTSAGLRADDIAGTRDQLANMLRQSRDDDGFEIDLDVSLALATQRLR